MRKQHNQTQVTPVIESEVPVVPIKKQVFFNENGPYNHITIYLLEEMEATPLYVDAIDVIENATPLDTIKLHITCYGGYLDTAKTIRTAIKQTKAKVVVYVPSVAMSAATMFFDIADEVYLGKDASIMIHEYSAGLSGKGQELRAQQEFYQRNFKEFTDDVYKPFLTEEELEKIHNGDDKYLTGAELAERLQNAGKFAEVV